jgi:uncharacterized membrane protein YphA (DoxX/SURF4 family)
MEKRPRNAAGGRGIWTRSIFLTSDSFVDMVLRLALAAVFFPHGAQNVPGWFAVTGRGAGMVSLDGAFAEKKGSRSYLLRPGGVSFSFSRGEFPA